ncbi:MAG: UDP-N-acetylglucosamine 2-epimerase (non-hydrolyzing) [Elusimicrobia bacterium]|nr:UDP-N-acetylglucosamine 2-epimerase (non-hydrolyzing) [Elusimicrobiota bacterium]
MTKKKILFVFGTRPEAIKLAPVIQEFKKERRFQTLTCVTGQHREMLDQVIKLFNIPIDHDLQVMTENQTLFDVTAGALKRLEIFYAVTKPDLVIVQGDTTTVMAAALAAYYQRIPVAHVEAGLRSFDVDNPFPEEVNRVVADRVSRLHFPPTKLSASNLLKEGIPKESVTITGNTVVDALLQISRIPHRWSDPDLFEFFNSQHSTRNTQLILLTSHRRENFGPPLEEICHAALRLVRHFKNLVFVYPVHLNPNVQATVRRILGGQKRIFLTAPAGYHDLVELIRRAYFIMTDSGGIQEEAPAFGKPVLILRRVTERPEAVMAGCARIVGRLSQANIYRHAAALLENTALYHRMARAHNPFGDGRASKRIRQATLRYFGYPSKISQFHQKP